MSLAIISNAFILMLFIFVDIGLASSQQKGYDIAYSTNNTTPENTTSSSIQYITPESASIEAAMKSSQNVHVFQEKQSCFWGKTIFHGFEPLETSHRTGIIFYPGGLVDEKEYAPLVRSMAELGYYVALANPILNLQVLDIKLADHILQYEPWKEKVDKWIITGHSLGGSMACSYASELEHGHLSSDISSKLRGLAIMAAYPSAKLDFRQSSYRVTSIFGTRDGLTTMDEIEASKIQFPSDTIYVSIEGANHSNFYYGGDLQNGDNEADITLEKQQELVRKSLHEFILLFDSDE